MGTVTIICGVSGSGKSTLGKALATRLNVAFVEGDDHHPRANIDKMAAGLPLDDDDRMPWLYALAGACPPACVVACSALKRRYRDVLRTLLAPQTVQFVLLHTDADVLARRLGQRQGHFMKRDMLEGQLDALELPQLDEREHDRNVLTLDASLPTQHLVELALQ